VDQKYMKKGREPSQLRFDKRFVEICKDVSYSPKTQYQLL